jgi:hypothetical protein
MCGFYFRCADFKCDVTMPPLNGAAIMNTKNKYNNVNNLPQRGRLEKSILKPSPLERVG